MSRINLENKYIDFIIETISAIDSEIQVYIYGSRTQNNAQNYSDVDIALKSKKSISVEKILRIKTLFQESTFPYKVDIIDLNSIEEYFYNIIKSDLVKIK